LEVALVKLSYVGLGVGLGVLVVSGTADFDRAAAVRASGSSLMQAAAVAEQSALAARKSEAPARSVPSVEQPRDKPDKKHPVKKPARRHGGKLDTEDRPDTDDDETALASTRSMPAGLPSSSGQVQ
jgi:hypothetical protein